MKKIICAALLGQAAILGAVEVNKTDESIKTIIQLDDYRSHSKAILESMKSTMSVDEFMDKIYDAYSQKDFQESIKQKFFENCNPDQIDEIYAFVNSDPYQKYLTEYSAFCVEVSPLVTQTLLGVLNSNENQPEASPGLSSEETDKTKYCIETLLMVDKYHTQAQRLISLYNSKISVDEFMQKIQNAYSQESFQETLRQKFTDKFSPEKIDEIYAFVTSDLYQKYRSGFYVFGCNVAPDMSKILMSVLQPDIDRIAAAAASQTPDVVNEKIVIANESNFEAILEKNENVIVDVYANWCGPCKALSPILNELAEEFDGKYVFVKIDADTNQNLLGKLNVRSLPTLLFYKGGKEADRKVGFASKEQLTDLLKTHFDS